MYSFDVFDTLITRITATPQGIFALIKDKLEEDGNPYNLDEYVIQNFYELRIHSEELARASCSMQNVEEVDLRDIYEAMAVCGIMEKAQIEYLCLVEESIEIANVTGMKDNISRLKALIAQGERVVLISDMYLSEKVIRKMLLQADDIFSDVPLYVSSEYKKRKTTGNLYRVVKDRENVSYDDWTHIGDNLYQDIEVPYNLGIRVEYVAPIAISDLEQELLERYGTDSRIQLMIGSAIRSERIVEKDAGTKGGSLKRNTAYHIGCRYVGPVLYSYAEWILSQAEKKKIRRLYFIARDGYLVKQIADIMIAERSMGITTKYIYGSRKAWRMPALSKEHYNLYQLMIWSHTNKIHTLQDLSEVLHICLQDLYRYLPGTLKNTKKDIQLTSVELEYIVDKLSQSKEFQDWHLKELKEERMLVQQYLSQKIDISDDSFAFVDVAGGGLTQGCLHELLKDRYPKPIHTFFFKIDRVNLVKESITDTFMPSFLPNNLTIEMMCRAPHGQTKGYRAEGGRIVPELEEGEGDAIIRHGFYDYEKGILKFSELMCKVSRQYNRQIGSLRNILLYLQYIAERPSQEVLDYFATVPSSDSGREEEIREYAPRLTEEDLKKIFLRDMSEPLEYYYKGSNLNYSILRASEKERNLIEKYREEYNSAAGRLFRQENERRQKELYDCFGRAAFYPVDLLEERLVLYGAGKFGRDLYRRLAEDKAHKIVVWVDKEAESYQKQGINQIQPVSRIEAAEFEQIVIAVVKKELADSIREELMQLGFDGERIVWIRPYNPINPREVWRTEQIG